MRLPDCLQLALNDALQAYCGQLCTQYSSFHLVLALLLVSLAICVAVLVLSKAPDPSGRLSQFITPTKARWPAHYSQSRITLSRLLQDLYTGNVELRYVEDSTDLFFDVDLRIDLESYFKLFWWKIIPSSSVETISEPLPHLVQEFGRDQCLSLNDTSNSRKASDTISSFAASLPLGTSGAIEFSTAPTRETSAFNRSSVLRNLPYMLQPETRHPPRRTLEETLSLLRTSLAGTRRIASIHNLSDAYSMYMDAYEDHWLVETKSVREEAIADLGIQGWRMYRLKLLLESALYRRREFERWAVILEKL